MDNERKDDAMLREELEVVVGGLTRPWAGFWEPADLPVGPTTDGVPGGGAAMPAVTGDI